MDHISYLREFGALGRFSRPVAQLLYEAFLPGVSLAASRFAFTAPVLRPLRILATRRRLRDNFLQFLGCLVDDRLAAGQSRPGFQSSQIAKRFLLSALALG
jgi:hypothetical protein